jgi:hypothetical protein
MTRWIAIGAGLLTLTSLAGGALAVTKADMDSCNQKAAQVAKATPAQPSTSSQPATPPPTGTTPQPSNNPSGGRITDSSAPGVPPSVLGMEPIGETDLSYRQAYLACITGK